VNYITIEASPAELAQFNQNEYFRITGLSLTIFNTGSSLEYEPSIEIFSIPDNISNSAETFRSTLRAEKESLVLKQQGRTNRRNLASATFQSLEDHKWKWRIEKSINDRYFISGIGLGWSGEKPIHGTWLYNAETGQMKPVDSTAIALLNIFVAY